MRMRIAQADSLMQADHDKVPEVFKAVALRPEAKKRMSHAKLLELKQHPDVLTNQDQSITRARREHPGVLTITAPETLVCPAFDTTVKRPVNERDDLVAPSMQR